MLVAAVGLLALAGAAPAQAAVRYADPAGTGSACTQADPCDVVQAISFAGPSDEVIVGSGTYSLGVTALSLVGSTNVHGEAGAPPPQLNFDNPPSPAIGLFGTARLADLRVHVAGASDGISLSAGTVAERVYVRTNGAENLACGVTLALLRDAVCFAPGANSEAVLAGGDGTVTLRNVTAVGGYLGLDAFAGIAESNLVVDIRNSVFEGPGYADIATFPLGTDATVEVDAAYSNYDSVDTGSGGAVPAPGTGTNQATNPLFVNPAAGDFHQLKASVTRNAGAAAPELGARDFEGDARVQGSAPDIGADEYDDTAPETRIVKGPRKPTLKRKARFVFASDDPGASFQCKLDKGAYKACKSPKLYRGLKRGRKHTVRIRAIDELGNVEATPAKRSWRVKKPKRKRR